MIAVIDYGMGNIGSIVNMIRKCGAEPLITRERQVLEKADQLILPGVGSFDHCMNRLREAGLIDLLNDRILKDRIPILGICLGMQLFSRSSEEGPGPGLGWIAGKTVRFQLDQHPGLKVPHMGWNDVRWKKEGLLVKGMGSESSFYFVHSYHVVCDEPDDTLGTTIHGYEFTSAIERDNVFATQFHPEKSHKFGFQIIKNFLDVTRSC